MIEMLGVYRNFFDPLEIMCRGLVLPPFSNTDKLFMPTNVPNSLIHWDSK